MKNRGNIQSNVASALEPFGSALVAVSGGADSVCLLDVVDTLRRERDLRIVVAHVNHGLRNTAERDEKFVRELCASREIALVVHKIQSDIPTSNIEDWARRIRYRFFDSALSDMNLEVILTAHTQSDFIETFLMRVLTNKEINLISQFDQQRRVVRPLLKNFRNEVIAYLTDRGLGHVNDETNQDVRYLRNRIRERVIPFLDEEFDGDIPAILSERANALCEDHEYLKELCRHSLVALDGLIFLSREWKKKLKLILSASPKPLRWRVTEELFFEHLHFRLGRIWGERVAEFIEGNSARIQLPGAFELVRKDGGFCLQGTN